MGLEAPKKNYNSNPERDYEQNRTLYNEQLKTNEGEIIETINKALGENKNRSEQSDLVEFKTKYEHLSPDQFKNIFQTERFLDNLEPEEHPTVDKMINFDHKAVEQERKKEGQKDHVERATILEELIAGKTIEKNAVNNGWFGENTKISQTTEFDDRFNATDAVLEFPNKEGETLHLAVDLTVTQNKDTVKNKNEKIYNQIKSKEKLTDIKYYGSPPTNRIEPLRSIPRVIFALERDSGILEDLCKSYLEEQGKQEKTKGEDQPFTKHFLPLFLLREAQYQLQEQKKEVTQMLEEGNVENREDVENIQQTIINTLNEIERIYKKQAESGGKKTDEAERTIQNMNKDFRGIVVPEITEEEKNKEGQEWKKVSEEVVKRKGRRSNRKNK